MLWLHIWWHSINRQACTVNVCNLGIQNMVLVHVYWYGLQRERKWKSSHLWPQHLQFHLAIEFIRGFLHHKSCCFWAVADETGVNTAVLKVLSKSMNDAFISVLNIAVKWCPLQSNKFFAKIILLPITSFFFQIPFRSANYRVIILFPEIITLCVHVFHVELFVCLRGELLLLLSCKTIGI